MKDDFLWERMQAALDARRDPLEDPQLRAWLAEDDEARGDFARLSGHLGIVERAGTVATQLRPVGAQRLRWFGLGAVLLAFGVLTARMSRPELSHAPELSPVLVLELECSIEVLGPGERTIEHHDARGRRITSIHDTNSRESPWQETRIEIQSRVRGDESWETEGND